MTGAAARPARPVLALAATLSVQAVATVALTAPSVMAPAVAPLLDVPPQRVGWLVGLAYLCAMFSGLGAGAVLDRAGAIRTSRVALLACAAGLAIGAAGGVAHAPALLVPAAIAIGLGYGLPNPAASIVLAAHAPPDRRGLWFSIKQTGVPVGVGVAGLVVPALLGLGAWPWTLLALAVPCVALAGALHAARSLEPRVPVAAAARAASPIAALAGPLRRVWREPALRRLGVASVAFSMTQLAFVTFVVSYLALEHGLGLSAAAGVLAVSQAVSVGCRVLWGQVADRWVSPPRLLAALGLAMGAAAAALGALPIGGPAGVALAVAVACAATSMAWNGVYFAELARRVRSDELGAVTGGTQFLTFCGAMAGPVVFASLVDALGSHAASYVATATVPAAVGVWLWLAANRERRLSAT